MGSRAYGLLELRHVIRRSVRALEGASAASVTSLRGFYVSKIQAAEGISPAGFRPPGLCIEVDGRVSIRLINRAPFRLWKLVAGGAGGRIAAPKRRETETLHSRPSVVQFFSIH